MGDLNKVPMSAFLIEHNLPLPGEIKIHSVSEISVDWDETAASGFHARSGQENHKCFDPGTANFPPITFSAHGNKGDTKAVYDTFKEVGQGNLLRGDITVKIINPKKQNESIIEVVMRELTLERYDPGMGGTVDNPTAVTFSFQVTPDRMEFNV
jgi:hypothetical protein